MLLLFFSADRSLELFDLPRRLLGERPARKNPEQEEENMFGA